MQISVIGTFNRDTTYPINGGKTESYGGLIFTVMGLSYLLDPDDKIYPICNVGHDIFDDLKKKLSSQENIVLIGLDKVMQKNNHVTLTYKNKDTRDEILTDPVPPIKFEQIEPFLNVDLIVINFISGFELSLETLLQIRRKSSGKIYMDIHSLTLGRDKNGRRFLKPIPEWQRWIEQTDVIQMNVVEANLLMNSNNMQFKDIPHFADYILDLGPEIFIMTCASEGSRIFYRNELDLVERGIKPYYTGKEVDPTGCGDIYAAAFISSYYKGGVAEEAATYASYISGLSCTLKGSAKINRFAESLLENPFRSGG